jgi:glycosyltransferase involved in cell wall biosynthesis
LSASASDKPKLALQVAVMKGRGGVLTSLFHYARLFDAAGVRSVCLYRGPAADALQAAGVDVVDAPSSIVSPLFRVTPDFGRVRAAIRERGGDPDFAMVHSDRALPAVKQMFPRAVAMTRCHSDNFKHKRNADLVVTLNPDQHERAQAALPRTRVRMFGNPFVPDPTWRGPKDEDGPGGRVRFNFIGRVEQVKDPLTLIRAFAAAALPDDAELRIIGAGGQKEEARRIASESGKVVAFTGWMSEPFSQFDRGDVLVLPSEWESYSWVIREALHHRVPVIASDIYVHREALGDGAFGRLLPVGDAPALAAELEWAVAHVEEFRAMAARGRDLLEQRYGAAPFWAKMRAEIEAIRQAKAA